MNKKKALIITVGGSDAAVVNAIKAYKPEIDFIYFICSGGKWPTASSRTIDGEGDVIQTKKEIRCKNCNNVIQKEERRKNILRQSGYEGGKYEKVEVNDPDNFGEVYQKTLYVINKAKEQGYQIIADFTGGTKTMSSVLAILTALDFEITPSLTLGPREDLIQVRTDSTPVRVDIIHARHNLILKIFDNLIARYLYFPASLLLENVMRSDLSMHSQSELRRKWLLAKGFNYWDMFEYEKAYENIKNYAEDFGKEFNFLLKLLNKAKNTGYEPAYDLISSAERQAFNGYFDNAVARLYRALELLAQIRLRTQYDIETAHIEKALERLKNREKWISRQDSDGEIKAGLKDSYEELLYLEFNDSVGNVYMENKNKFLNMLKLRNSSKLAHGDIPVGERQWKEFNLFCRNFIESTLNSIGIKKIEYIQLPTRF